jgi:hypothetical protein
MWSFTVIYDFDVLVHRVQAAVADRLRKQAKTRAVKVNYQMCLCVC